MKVSHDLSVLFAPDAVQSLANLSTHKSPFTIEGAPNVMLETVKRAEDDPKKKLTRVILRIYEAYGGHATATLRIASHLTIERAYICNLLEERSSGPLDLVRDDSTGDSLVKLPMRGFQILTVRLAISNVAKRSYVIPHSLVSDTHKLKHVTAYIERPSRTNG